MLYTDLSSPNASKTKTKTKTKTRQFVHLPSLPTDAQLTLNGLQHPSISLSNISLTNSSSSPSPFLLTLPTILPSTAFAPNKLSRNSLSPAVA